MKPVAETLVILAPGFPANEADSTCLPAQQAFVRELTASYVNIEIIILAFQYPFTSEPYHWNGCRVIPFNGRNKGKTVRLRVWRQAWKTLKKIKSTSHVVGLFSFWCTECALLGHYFGRRQSLPHYTWILGQDARKENKYVRLIRPSATSLVAMSDFLAAEFARNHGICPGHIITNGIDPALYGTAPAVKDIDILAAGSLIPLKRYDMLVRIAGKIAPQLPGIKVLLCGKGPEEEALRLLIRQLQLEDTVILQGELPHTALLQQMQRAKLFLHTSMYEGFSTVCIEALFAGAEVLSFCQPMEKQIEHWHIVNSEEEMTAGALAVLQKPSTLPEPSVLFTMKDSAKAVMKLFGR